MRDVAWGDVISSVAARNVRWSLNPDVEELVRYNLDGLRRHCKHSRRVKLVDHDDAGYHWRCKDCGLPARSPEDYPREAGTMSRLGFDWTATPPETPGDPQEKGPTT